MRRGGELPDGLDGRDRQAVGAARGARPASASATRATRCSSRCARARPSRCPGMMDTILNLGLNDDAVEGLARATGNERFAFDAYRRLIQMYGDVVDGRRRPPVRAGARRPQGRARRRSGRRARGRRPARARRPLPGDLPERAGRDFPQDAARPARARGPRRLRLLGDAAGAGVPARQRDPRRPRHGRERRPDGLREQGRRLRHRRRLHA